MLQDIRIFLNNNRKKILVGILIIASLIILVQLLNFFTAPTREEQETVNMTTDKQLAEIENQTNVNLSSTQSAVSGENISSDKLKSDSKIIGAFFNACNQRNLEDAYNMLTDECKEQMYNSLEVFEQAYYNNVFNGEQKVYTVENWTGNIYKVDISEDILSTGKSNNGYVKQDYVTIEDGKLNINNYIGYTQFNETTEKDDISMTILARNTYMDHEEYTIRVTNNKEEAIQLDGLSNVKSLHLEDSRGSTYSAYTNELTQAMLRVEPGETKEVTIKFYSRYVSNKTIDYIVFSNLLVYNAQGSESEEFKANV